jgi:RelA/SpoT family (p)ppGpp synthetase
LISDLLQIVEQYLDSKEVKAIYRAYLFGAEAHEGQVRHSGEAYIFHPLSVARILADMRLDSRSIIAALLHDVIEDTPTAKKELVAQFGKDVAQLVDGVSKIDQIEFDSPEHAEAENFRKMLLAMSKDIRVILIKLADRIHNMHTLDALRVDRRKRISQQTLDIFAPIANRLGMHEWTQELEDLSFCNLYPKRYNTIRKELDKRRRDHRPIIGKTMAKIKSELAEAGLEGTVEGREKSIYSIYRKRRERGVPLSEMRDFFAIRIRVPTVDDCYRALGTVHNTYKPVPGGFKDYIAIPKANGYRSLHTLLFGTFGQSIEVQIRTEEMHRVAETGVASHWRYKTGKKKSGPQMPTHSWLVDLLDTQQAGDPSDFLEHLKTDLFPDEVYVFTPQGDIKKLPKGASALDFAYAVHSDIGNHCIGARINNESVPLHQELGNGNHVEILTARSAVPTPLWLNYAVTGKARAAIRNFLKTQQEGDAVKLGRQLLDRALKSEGLKEDRVAKANWS